MPASKNLHMSGRPKARVERAALNQGAEGGCRRQIGRRARLSSSSRRVWSLTRKFFEPRATFLVGLFASDEPFWAVASWSGLEGDDHGQRTYEGAADKAKGAVKDAAGKIMDDKSLQAEGKMDKAKGEARQALGDAKDAVKHVRNEH
jgi:uncharacterized protein YjbJ (UPF0337 family)